MKKLILLLLVVSACLTLAPKTYASREYCELSLSDVRKLVQHDPDFKDVVVQGEDRVASKDQIRFKILESLQGIENEIKSIKASMTWKEKILRRFAGIIGGDGTLTPRLKPLKKNLKRTQGELDNASNEMNRVNNELNAQIENWLQTKSDFYRGLISTERQLDNLICSGRDCESSISTAISDLESAADEDTMGGLTENQSLEIIGAMDSADAKREARGAIRAYARFQQDLRNFNTHLQNIQVSLPSDTVNFLDMMGGFSGGVDVFAFVNASQLNNTADDLRYALQDVSDVRQSLEGQYEEVKSRIDDYNCVVRGICTQKTLKRN